MVDLVLVSALGMGIVALGSLIYTASLVRLVRLMRAVSDRKTEELKLQMRQLRSYSQRMYEDFRNSSRNESVKWATIFDEDPLSLDANSFPDDSSDSQNFEGWRDSKNLG